MIEEKDNQKYGLKNFIISFDSHKTNVLDNTCNIKPKYRFKVETGKNFNDSILSVLLSEKYWQKYTYDSLFEEISGPSYDISFKVRLVIHSHKDFSIGQVSYAEDTASFAQEFFPDPTKEISGKEQQEGSCEYLPIVHITLDSSYVDNLYGNKKLPSRISRSYQILDNSIWNKIVPFNRIETDNYQCGGLLGLYSAICEIDKNYQRGLYNLQITHEYVNLNARLTKQAFLSGSHASGVSPFIFHSESAIKQLIIDEFVKVKDSLCHNKIEIIANHSWRFLLVDDKATEPLSTIKGKEERNVSKLDILKPIFQDLFPNSIIDIKPCTASASSEDINKQIIVIEYADNIDEAEKGLKTKEYDAILLDYYLEKQEKVEYGYQLLEDIYQYHNQIANSSKDTNEDSSFKIGPHKKLFFMFISAYSTAVYERLLAEGLNRSEKFWYIGEGACPTNTPELFKYRLLHLMNRRLDQTGIINLSFEYIIKQLEDIFSQKTDIESRDQRIQRIKSVREKAYEQYKNILGLHYDYFSLKQDEKYSLLVKCFLKDKVHMGALLEHLLQFIHLVAFGTVRQWPDIWEEYNYFSRAINVGKESLQNLARSIEQYIIDLKSES